MKMKKALPLTLAGAVAVVLTACNLNGLPNSQVGTEGTISETTMNPTIGKPGANTPVAGAPGSVQTNPNIAISTAKPNASVSGQVLDSQGNPVADAYVFAANGQVAKTDANGQYSIAVTAESGKEVNLIFQKEGYVFSSERITLEPGGKAFLDGNVKKLDPEIVNIDAAVGGTFKNSTGVLEVDVPAGALTGNAMMQMTPLSFGQGGLPNELPGPLETVDENGDRMLLMPAEYWSIDLAGANLKEGESMTMRMKLPPNPNAPVPIKAGDMIPCYIYDAELGYWNSPNLGPVIEKDGALWATYEIKASSLTNRAEALTRSVQHIHAGTDKKPLSDDQLRHNAMHLAEGAGNTFAGLGSAGGGVIGGHTFYPLFGTIMQQPVVDEKDKPLAGVSVQVQGGGNPGAAGPVGGDYQRLQYRGQSVKVKATLNEYVEATVNRTTAPSNKVRTPDNQYGYWTGDYMESRSPETAKWEKIVLDTRHPLNVTFKGETAPSDLKLTLKTEEATVPATFSRAGNTASTPKVLDRAVKYTLVAESASASGHTTFTVPADTVKGKPFAINLDLVGLVK